jgi:exosome complex component RRP42
MILQKQYIKNLASKGQRTDGRKPEDFRDIVIEKNAIEKAEGSARVNIGGTDVIVGIKMSMGEPYPDKEDEGVMIVGAELSPMASPDFEPGPPSEQAIELARVVDRGIRESGTIDTKKLCIKKGEKVWMVNVDIYVMNHMGNLIDAAAIAAVTAIWNAKFPELKGDRIDYENKSTKKLPTNSKPVTITVVKIGDSLMVDPDLDEENAANARLTIAVKDNDNICALQKGGIGTMTVDEIEKSIELAVKKSKEIRKMMT